MPSPQKSPVRTTIVAITIGSFSIAALMGVTALLGGGDFGETEVRILLTTLLAGVSSIAVLCYLATGGTRFQTVGVVGGLAALVPLATGLAIIWGDPVWGDDDGPLKAFGVGAIVAGSLAQVCLLLAVAGRARPGVRGLLVATVAVITLMAAQTSLLVLEIGQFDDAYLRILGVVAILDVLGTVVVAALGRTTSEDGVRTLGVPDDLAAQVSAYAARSGQQPATVVRQAIEQYLA